MKKILLLLPLLLILNFSVKADNYLSTTAGNSTDTINTASTNDTSAVFKNPYYTMPLTVVYTQNSTTNFLTIVAPSGSQIKAFYLAADSSVTFRVNTGVGWTICQLQLSGTQDSTVTKLSLPLKTGTMIFGIKYD